MRVKVLRNIGRKDTLPRDNENPAGLELPAKPDGRLYQEGEVADFSKDVADRFVKAGLGELVDAKDAKGAA